jgi:hypothetical protein
LVEAAASFTTFDQPRNRKKKTANQHHGGGNCLAGETFLFTSALAEITSSESFLSREGTAASPTLGCRAHNFGQLLMSGCINHGLEQRSSAEVSTSFPVISNKYRNQMLGHEFAEMKSPPAPQSR